MTVKLLSEHHLEFLSLKGGFIGLSESTCVKMPHCWKSHVTAQFRVKFRPLALHDTSAWAFIVGFCAYVIGTKISCAGPNDQADYMANVCNNG